MKKSGKNPAPAPRAADNRKVSIKDLAAKRTDSVKGGQGTIPKEYDIIKKH